MEASSRRNVKRSKVYDGDAKKRKMEKAKYKKQCLTDVLSSCDRTTMMNDLEKKTHNSILYNTHFKSIACFIN